MPKLAVIAVVVAGCYAAVAAWPVVDGYFSILFAAQKLANQTAENGRSHGQTRAVLAEIRTKSGLEVYSSDVEIRTLESTVVVDIATRVPVVWPLLDRVHYYPIAARRTAPVRARR